MALNSQKKSEFFNAKIHITLSHNAMGNSRRFKSAMEKKYIMKLNTGHGHSIQRNEDREKREKKTNQHTHEIYNNTEEICKRSEGSLLCALCTAH